MRREDALRTLRQNQAEIRRFGVRSLFLFGSTASDQAGSGSDVDLYFDFDERRFSLIELAGLQQRVMELLGSPADVMSRGSLHPRLRARIEQTALQVF